MVYLEIITIDIRYVGEKHNRKFVIPDLLISIELISRGESSLKSVLDSIRNQTFKNYEVVCVDSSGNEINKKLLLDYGCKVVEVPKETGHLKARYLSHKESNGDKSLILDSTRPLKEEALSILDKHYNKRDMVILREDSLGQGFWVEQARKLKIVSEMQSKRAINETLAFLLPRFYSSSILTQAFENIYKNTNIYFDRISYGEHHLIFEACRRLSDSVVMSDEILLSHYEDNSFLTILKKYYRYGKMQKVLKNIPESTSKSFFSHVRKGIGLKYRIETLPISVTRGIPFIVGYLF